MNHHVRTIQTPRGTFKLGRHAPVAPRQRMRLESYLTGALPTPATSLDLSPKAMASINEVYLNDQLGDCVIAGLAHILGMLTGNATGSPFLFTKAQILSLYEPIGGYVPGDPSTDQGCNEQDALDYCAAHALPDGTKFLGSVLVNAEDETQVKQAFTVGENLMLGVGLPDKWIDPFPSASGFVWDVATPDQNNGHCVVVTGYNAQGVQIATWGMIGTITWAAFKKVCAAGVGELHLALSPDQLAKGQSLCPNGLAWDNVVADFNLLGGKVPVPGPAPSPAPASAKATLAQAQKALASGWPGA